MSAAADGMQSKNKKKMKSRKKKRWKKENVREKSMPALPTFPAPILS